MLISIVGIVVPFVARRGARRPIFHRRRPLLSRQASRGTLSMMYLGARWR
jgi:hypothetical protein